MRRIHPAQGLPAWKKLSFLLLLPLLRRLPELQGMPALGNVSVDLLTIGIVVGSGFLWTERYRLYETPESLRLRAGFFFRKETRLSYDSVSWLQSVQTISLRLLRAREWSVFTAHGHLRFCESQKNCVPPWFHTLSIPSTTLSFQESFSRLLFSQFSRTHAASGILVAAPLLQKAGQVFGTELLQSLADSITPRLQLIALGIPPSAAAIAQLLLLGWGIAFARHFSEDTHLTFRYNDTWGMTIRGLFSHRQTWFRFSEVRAYEIRQTWLTRLAGLRTVSALLPDGTGIRIGSFRPNELKKLPLPNFILPPATPFSRPVQTSRKNPALLPFFGLCVIALLATIMESYLPKGLQLLLIFPGIFLLVQTLFRFSAANEIGCGISDHMLIVVAFRGTALIEYRIPTEQITAFEWRQSPFQKIWHRYTLRIRPMRRR